MPTATAHNTTKRIVPTPIAALDPTDNPPEDALAVSDEVVDVVDAAGAVDLRVVAEIVGFETKSVAWKRRNKASA